MSNDDTQIPQVSINGSEIAAPDKHSPRQDTISLKVEILGYLEVAISRFPRSPGETFKAWLDRVIPQHMAADEYHLVRALGIARGAGINIRGDEFETALHEQLGDAGPARTSASEELRDKGTPGSDSSESTSLQFEQNETLPWRRKRLGDFSVDQTSWVAVRVRFNRDHYMSNNLYECIGASRVGREVEAALADGHTYDSIFQEGLTKIRQIDGNHLMVKIGDLIDWSGDGPDFWAAFRALEKEAVSEETIFKAGLAALRPEATMADAVAQLNMVFDAPPLRVREILEAMFRLREEPFMMDDSTLEEERTGVWVGTFGDAPPRRTVP